MSTRFPSGKISIFLLLILLFLLSCSRSDPVTPSGVGASDTLQAPATDLQTSDPAQAQNARTLNPSAAPDIPPYAPDEVLVSLKDGAVPAGGPGKATGPVINAAISILAKRGLSLQKAIDVGRTTVYLLKILDGSSVPEKIRELKGLPQVDTVEPNITFQFCDVPYAPNDPLWENPNDADDDPRTNVFEQFGPSKIGASTVWNDTKGEGIVVCIMDTGVQVWHEDLENVMWVNEDEIPDNGIDDDLNGYVDDIYGWDMQEDDNDITEYNGDNWYHGTACAGVVAAEQDNSLGCSGIAPHARIMGIKIGMGYSFLSEILNGMIYARHNGADIVSMSFSTTEYSIFLKYSMQAAWDDGLLLAAAAANDDVTTLHYPAAFDTVICVGGTSPFWKPWSYKPIDEVRISKAAGFDWGSNYGPQLEIMGFGEDYITTHGGNDHSYWDGKSDYFFRGTSNATPFVAGGLALLKSVFPEETNQWLRDRAKYTSDDLDVPGFDEQTGWGRINALRACYGPDRYAGEEDEDGFVDLAAHGNQVIDSIHAVTGDYTDTEDLYKFTATQDGNLNFFLDIWTWGENLDLTLYSSPTLAPSTQIDQSAKVNHCWSSFEVVGAECLAGETYYVKVTPAGYGDSTSYTLNVEYVEPYLGLTVHTYETPFVHKSVNNLQLGYLDFTSSLRTRITKLIFSVGGTMPANKITSLKLYKDTYANGSLDWIDIKIADAKLNGTNRIVFSNLYEEISASISPTRYFLTANIAGVDEDATFDLVLTSYKDVETYEGIEIAYDAFPYTIGPFEVGVDIEPPTWDTTVGVQFAHPRYEGAAVYWNNATDARTPPAKYNVYWTTEPPINFTTAEHEDAVGFWDGGDYDHMWIIPDLINDQEYFLAVRAEDQAGNEDLNEVCLSVIASEFSDPAWPQVVGSLDTPGDAREVKADPSHQRVFVADGDGGLLIVDVSDPTEPVLSATVPESAVKGVDYDGTYVYGAYASGLVIVDPDAAEGPDILSTVDFSDALRVLVVNNWAYVTKNGTDLLPVDVSDPFNPVPYPVVTSGDRGYALNEQNGYLYIATFSKPRVFSLADPSAPVEVANNFGADQAHDILALGNRLYTAYWNDKKFSIYDLTDPALPVYINNWVSDSGSNGSTVVMFNGYLYFGTQAWGIEVLDVTDPMSIAQVGEIATNGPDGMDTDGKFIYSAENEHGLKIIL